MSDVKLHRVSESSVILAYKGTEIGTLDLDANWDEVSFSNATPNLTLIGPYANYWKHLLVPVHDYLEWDGGQETCLLSRPDNKVVRVAVDQVKDRWEVLVMTDEHEGYTFLTLRLSAAMVMDLEVNTMAGHFVEYGDIKRAIFYASF